MFDFLKSLGRHLLIAAPVLTASFAVGPAFADTITFGELPPNTPLDSPTFSGAPFLTVDGITFSYTEFGSPSPAACFGCGQFGSGTMFIQDPELSGPSDGVLTMDFTTPITSLSFDVALDTPDVLTPGYTVSSFDSTGDLLGVDPIETAPFVAFSEGLFSYSGAPVSSVSLSFDGDDSNNFSLGDLSFVPVPEPTSLSALAVGLFVVGWVRRRGVRRCSV
jgi:hypothetical protein